MSIRAATAAVILSDPIVGAGAQDLADREILRALTDPGGPQDDGGVGGGVGREGAL